MHLKLTCGFKVENNLITDYTFAQLRENKIEEGFVEMKEIIKTAINSLSNVLEENTSNSNELFELLKQSVKSSEFWKNAQSKFDNLVKIKDFLLFWRI